MWCLLCWSIIKNKDQREAEKPAAVQVISLRRKEPFITTGPVKKTFPEVGVSVTGSAVERNHTTDVTPQYVN